MSLTDDTKHHALQLGFDMVGITDASPIDGEQVELLGGWLKSGYAGQMDYMHRNFEKRINPAQLLEGAQSVICVGLSYKPQKQDVKPPDSTVPTGRVAHYAQYEDYHVFMKGLMRKLVDFISSIAGANHKFKFCVDSAPLAERALAARAGLGFIGKNHMLINPTLGPQIFLGEIVTTVKLQPNEPIANNCSNCDRCLTACPTGALRADGQFDANKCISYLTIEHKGQIAPYLAEKIGNRLFGCDECVLACPYQEGAAERANKQFRLYGERAELDLRWILNMKQDEFDAEFGNSVIKRLGLERLKRNVHVCLGDMDSQKV